MNVVYVYKTQSANGLPLLIDGIYIYNYMYHDIMTMRYIIDKYLDDNTC